MTGTGLQREALAPQARKMAFLAAQAKWRSQVKAHSAGRSHKPRNLAKSVTVE